MGRYLIRRVLFGILVLWIISVLTFVIFVKLPPGDPARRLAGKAATPENIERIRTSLGLNEPIPVQYLKFAKGLVPLPGFWLDEDVYYSYANNVPVKDEITERLPVTGHDELAELSSTFNGMLDGLEEAFDTQQRFVDDAGHELRTPITVIRGHLDLMGDDPEERRATLALIDDELGRMHRIVNDLLTLAKAERADFLRLGPVDLAALTEEVHAKAEALGDRRWHLGAVGRGIVIADRQRLTQALMQLAQNAVQHTAAGDEIEIGSRVLGVEVELWVRDTGEGISPDEVERIFDRFARGGRKRASDGAGLGLSIVRAIAEAHHGRVSVRSRPGEGSRFVIVVPVDQPLVVPGELA